MRKKGKRNNFTKRHSRPYNSGSKNFHRKSRRKSSPLKKLNWFTRKHPIATGVILIIASIVLFRLSFTNAFLSSKEFFGWSLLLSTGLFLAGILVLIAYWRNNVSMFTTRHNVKWKNK